MTGNDHYFQVNVGNDFLVNDVLVVSFGNSFLWDWYENNK
jgi:hypothetical protein